jgi:UDP-glucuronate 4-epimerase
MQEDDIKETLSDIKEMKKYIGYNPKTNVNEDIKKFIDWYKKYHSIWFIF